MRLQPVEPPRGNGMAAAVTIKNFDEEPFLRLEKPAREWKTEEKFSGWLEREKNFCADYSTEVEIAGGNTRVRSEGPDEINNAWERYVQFREAESDQKQRRYFQLVEMIQAAFDQDYFDSKSKPGELIAQIRERAGDVAATAAYAAIRGKNIKVADKEILDGLFEYHIDKNGLTPAAGEAAQNALKKIAKSSQEKLNEFEKDTKEQIDEFGENTVAKQEELDGLMAQCREYVKLDAVIEY